MIVHRAPWRGTNLAMAATVASFMLLGLPLARGQALPVGAPAGANLVLNAGFEEGRRGWQFWPRDNTTKTRFEIDTAVFQFGQASARITATDLADTGSLYAYVPVTPGTRYHLRFSYKLQEIVPDSALLNVSVNFNKAGGGNGSAGRVLVRLPEGLSTTSWQTFESAFTTPENAAMVQLVVNVGHVAGTVWVDEVSIAAHAAAASAAVEEGLPADERWKGIEPLTGFLGNTAALPLAAKQTRVYLTRDQDQLHLRLVCDEPNLAGLSAHDTGRDGAVAEGLDDCIEVFICPHNITYHFIVNSLNALYDETITGSDTSAKGFVGDAAYNPKISSKTFRGKDFWGVDLAIPFSELGGPPGPDDTWKVNFTRVERQMREYSSFSPLNGRFYQPARFSELRFTQGRLLVTRSSKQLDNPFKIVRAQPLFKDLLLPVAGGYQVGNFSSEISTFNRQMVEKQISHADWASNVVAVLDEWGRAGMMGPNLHAVASTQRMGGTTNTQFWNSREACRQYYDVYGMRRAYVLETAAAARTAIARGAEIQDRRSLNANQPLRAIREIDPAYEAVILEDIRKAATLYKDEPYLAHFFGRDEPMIHAISGLMKDISPQMAAWNREVTENFGFGKYGIPAPDDPAYHTNKETHPFQWIAFNRWKTEKFVTSRQLMRTTLQSIAPRITYIPCNFWTMRAFIPYDFDRMAECGDAIQCDPYPGSGETRYGRGLYTVGFTTKLIRDLTGLPTWCYVQAWDYDNCSPEPDDLRAWVSQALKVGATGINLYEENSPRLTNPKRYAAMLRIAAFVTRMNKVAVPEAADTAIFYSSASHGAEGACCRGDEVYTAYSLVGERAGSWFDFVSDSQLVSGKRRLADYRVIYIPLATYQDRAVVEMIEQYVLQGGMIVVGDPTAFSHDINGDDLAADRERILGVKLGDTVQPREARMTEARFGLQRDDALRLYPNYIPLEQKAPCYNYRRSYDTREVIPVDQTVRVLARFKAGGPAIMERRLGKGRIIYFGANPFIPDVVRDFDSKWAVFFAALQAEAGCNVSQPIWNFELPGEVVAPRGGQNVKDVPVQ